MADENDSNHDAQPRKKVYTKNKGLQYSCESNFSIGGGSSYRKMMDGLLARPISFDMGGEKTKKLDCYNFKRGEFIVDADFMSSPRLTDGFASKDQCVGDVEEKIMSNILFNCEMCCFVEELRSLTLLVSPL
jgi:hypothetical protein